MPEVKTNGKIKEEPKAKVESDLVETTKNKSNEKPEKTTKKQEKKVKAHRGYAFVVFERAKDMTGNSPLSTSSCCGTRRRHAICDLSLFRGLDDATSAKR